MVWLNSLNVHQIAIFHVKWQCAKIVCVNTKLWCRGRTLSSSLVCSEPVSPYRSQHSVRHRPIAVVQLASVLRVLAACCHCQRRCRCHWRRCYWLPRCPYPNPPRSKCFSADQRNIWSPDGISIVSIRANVRDTSSELLPRCTGFSAHIHQYHCQGSIWLGPTSQYTEMLEGKIIWAKMLLQFRQRNTVKFPFPTIV